MPTATFIATSLQELHDRIDVACERFGSLANSLPAELAIGDWTNRGVVAHLVNVVNRYNEFDPARLAADPRGVDDINDRELSTLADRSMPELLDDLDLEMRTFRTRWGPESGLALDMSLPFHGGGTIDLQSGLTNLLAEFLVHGLDVAQLAGIAWPIEDRDGALVLGFATQILPAYVRRANTASILIRCELDGLAPWALDVRGPSADSREPLPGDQPQLVLRGNPTPLALMFYGRCAPEDFDALDLRVEGGSHPELVTQLPELFEVP